MHHPNALKPRPDKKQKVPRALQILAHSDGYDSRLVAGIQFKAKLQQISTLTLIPSNPTPQSNPLAEHLSKHPAFESNLA